MKTTTKHIIKALHFADTAMLCFILLGLCISACSHIVRDAKQVDCLPKIFPDYVGVTIPEGIAPLNFDYVGGEYEWMEVVLKGSKGGEVRANGEVMDIDIDDWHSLVKQNVGGAISVTLYIEKDGIWRQYKDFEIKVSNYALDEWGVTYRRIAPGYEVYGHMGLYQRNLSTFDEYEIIDNKRMPGTCVNCHTSNRTNPNNFVFHARGEHGATAVQKNGKMQILDTKTDKTLGLCVYPYWHPDGRFVAFSTNTTRQSFHAVKDERIEVFDLASDLQVYDTETNELILSPLVKGDSVWETFPAFSADGKTLYYCAAEPKQYPMEFEHVRYNLYSIGFDAKARSFGKEKQLVIDAVSQGKSVTLPRPSYDGKYLMYTVANYGTFPIWHKEADLWLLDLQSGVSRPIDEVNSSDTDSFHNWNVNSHWFVFSSRRGNGLYTRLYLASIDEEGKVSKPFLLPQRNPRKFYDDLMYSYNVPDFTAEKVEIDSRQTANGILSEKRIKLTVHQ